MLTRLRLAVMRAKDDGGGAGGADDHDDDDHQADDDDHQADDDDHDDDDDGAGVLGAIKAGFDALGGTITDALARGKDDAVTSSRDDGAGVEDQVRRALERVGKEKETDDRIGRLEKVVERPPRKQSRLERAIWGKVDA